MANHQNTEIHAGVSLPAVHGLTVVIPTLGGECLKSTIAALNRGSVIPDEILVCIPRQHADRVDAAWPNVTVVATECRGQVAQRAVGFRRASYPMVMQLDDDLIVERDCVERLIEGLRQHGPDAAVSPLMVNAETGESIYRKPARSRAMAVLYSWLMNASVTERQGGILRSGGTVGVDPQIDDRACYHVEWLPGGCVLHHRENLVLEDFYPFAGKAYCEDIIHSHHMARRGITAVVMAQARCSVEPPPCDSTYPPRQFIREVRADFHARRYYMRLTGRGPFRLYLLVLSRCASYIARRIATTVRSYRPGGRR